MSLDRDLVLRLRAAPRRPRPGTAIRRGRARDRLRHRVLHLQPRVHLHEAERVGARPPPSAMNSTVRRRHSRPRAPPRPRLGPSPHAPPPSFRAPAPPRSPSGVAAAASSRARKGEALPVRVGEHLDLDMTRARATYFSISTRASPKALSASRCAASSASAKSSGASTRRMPLPPPPATALISTGKPIASASARRSARSPARARDSRARRERRPAPTSAWRVLQAHRPDRRRRRPDEDDARPLAQASANPAFSERKP